MRGFHRGLALLLLCAACTRTSMQSGRTPEGAIDQATAEEPATWLEARTVEIEPAPVGRRVVIALSREPEHPHKIRKAAQDVCQRPRLAYT